MRSDPDEEIHEEIELYLELRATELEEAEGLAPGVARRVAEERFGDTKRIERTLRRQARQRSAREGRTMTMDGLRQDLAYAVRTFRRSPGFTVVAVLTLGLALGGNTAVFSVVDAALLQAMPFEDHERLVFVNGYHLVDGEISVRGASFPEFRDWRERSRTVSPMAATSTVSLAATGDGEAERLATEIVTEGYFELLGHQALLGRTLLPEEHREPDAFPVAVVSHRLWERRYALSEDVLGHDLVVNDRPLTIVGVMPPGFGGTSLETDLWVPESMISLVAGVETLDARGSRFLTVLGRLTDGVDVDAAQLELDEIARALQADFPRDHEDRFAQVEDFRSGYLGSTGGLLWILMGAGVLLLLIAAANVSNLLLVRSHGRTREIVLRRALGAEGGRIAGQLLTESVLLAVLGGLAGVGISVWALAVLGPMIPTGVLPGYVDPALSGRAFGFTLGVLSLVGIATGVVPAAAGARMQIATRLRDGAGGGGGASLRRLRAQHFFVVAQVALALVLLVGAGLLTRSFRAQLAVDTGSDLTGVVAMRMQLPTGRYDQDPTAWALATELEREVGSIPGVTSVSISSQLPFRGGSSGSYILREGDGPDDRIRFHRHYVTPGYFETLGIEVREGRTLNENDRAGTPTVAVITQAMADRVFPGERAVGKVMWLRPGGSATVEIVGVIEDVRYRDVTTSLMADANSPDVFFSYWQSASYSMEVAARLGPGADAGAVMRLMRDAVGALDPDLPVFQLEPLVDGWLSQTATPRFAAFLMGLFSVLAAVLACVGIYGVLAFAVGERSREIAIRRAIGASTRSVAGAVIGDGLKLAGVGLAVGGAASLTATGVLERFLFGVPANDPVTFLTVGGAMVAVAVAAAVVPALRAMRRDPAEALHAD